MTAELPPQNDSLPLRFTRWQVLLMLVGFPLAYWLNSFTPWSYGLFVKREHGFFIPVGISICVLHWSSFFTAIWFVKQAGGKPRDIGLRWHWMTIVGVAVTVAIVGGLLIALRIALPVHTEPPSDWRFYYPFTIPERCLFVFMAFSAGVCEETVYRGFALTALQARGWRPWQAALLATLSFILVHGIAGLFLSPFLFVVGVLYSVAFLRWRSLTPLIVIHALFDVMAVMAI